MVGVGYTQQKGSLLERFVPLPGILKHTFLNRRTHRDRLLQREAENSAAPEQRQTCPGVTLALLGLKKLGFAEGLWALRS